MTSAALRTAVGPGSSWLLSPYLAILVVALVVPLLGNDYWTVVASRVAVYWVLIAGLNLAVGFAGQLAIGWIALLTLGAYTASALVVGNLGPAWHPAAALVGATVIGALAGLVVGLPALRLGGFYFAMTTLGFATILTQVALAWEPVTGGGTGIPGPIFPHPFDSVPGFYLLCVVLAVAATWITSNLAQSRVGRSLVALRDTEVAAESVGISRPRLFAAMFLVSGGFGALAGGLFATLQSYLSYEAFTLDLSILFFIAILIGGRNSILGPLLGTILLTLLPEVAAPLVRWSAFLYAVLLLAIVLVIPGGIAQLIDFANRKPLPAGRTIKPRPDLLPRLAAHAEWRGPLRLQNLVMNFDAVRAIDDVTCTLHSGRIHGLIGPNGSGKTTLLNIISGYNVPSAGSVSLGDLPLPRAEPEVRAELGIARTFQRPRIAGELSVLDNVLVGGAIGGTATFPEIMAGLPRYRRDEARLAEEAMTALRIVGLEALAGARAERLQHSELRFVEIARALMLRPRLILMDEPAAGLSAAEIAELDGLIKALAQNGVGIVLVEHHADLIFGICDEITVMNGGRILAEGSPAEIRRHPEVIDVYLGA
ncbi:ABC transporter permease subunit [Enterovirga sp. CN4-39]|uniref:branched-chain amino acid ABC transporter ATP-binding protein/permease n=1 Tax=Enterovirga sp. CN4-39 TaxID=3400910 RepID=UPI003BFC3DF5